MSEEKNIRLAKAASEFNVAISHIADLLKSKGFTVDPKPTTKLSEEMYNQLLKEFGKDKDLKGKADSLSIGIGRKLEKEKTDKPEEVAVVEPVKKVEEVEVVEKVVVQKEVPEVKEIKEEIPVIEKQKEPEVEVIKARKEKVEEIKIVGKIDLDRKKTKKPVEEPKIEEPVKEEVAPVVEAKTEIEKPEIKEEKKQEIVVPQVKEETEKKIG